MKLDITKTNKIRFNDYSSYESERGSNGGCYGFWTNYTKRPDGLWEISYGTTSDMDFCPCCGMFGNCLCDGEYETVTEDELVRLVNNFHETEDEWIEIF